MRRNVGKELKTFEVERMIREPEREGMALILEERLELDSARGQERFFRHAAALANTSAGHLAVGVATDRRPVGLSERLDEGQLNRLATQFFGLRLGLQYVTHTLSDGTTIGWLFVPAPGRVVVVPKNGEELREGDVYVRRGGESVRANANDMTGLIDAVMAARGYCKVTPMHLYRKPPNEPVVAPPDLGKVLAGVRARRRSDFLEFHDRIDLEDPVTVAPLLRDIAAFANARGGYIAVGAGSAAGAGETGISDLRRLVETYLRPPVELVYSEHQVPGGGRVGLLYVPALDRVAPLDVPLVYETNRETVTALREGDVWYREGAADVPATSRHYDLIIKKIAAAKDLFILADDLHDGWR